MPTPTQVGQLPEIASGLNVASLLGPKSIPPRTDPDVVGAFRFTCSAGQLRKDDPIVYPNQPGRAHLHQFYGNLTAAANSTYETLRKNGDTTCQNALNRSSYWVPALLDGKGNVIVPDFISLYYKQRPASDPFCTTVATACVGTPRGLRFIAGWDQTRPNEPQPENAARFNFKCIGSTGHPTTGTYPNLAPALLAACKPGMQLSASINTPQCWNGTDLDTPNHRDHVVDPIRNNNTGLSKCPPTHPLLIPQVTQSNVYTIGEGDDPTLFRFSSDHMLPAGGVPGDSFHSDYFEAWEDVIRTTWQTNCIDKKLQCVDGDLGNGTIMLRGPYYPSTFKAIRRLVPVP